MVQIGCKVPAITSVFQVGSGKEGGGRGESEGCSAQLNRFSRIPIEHSFLPHGPESVTDYIQQEGREGNKDFCWCIFSQLKHQGSITKEEKRMMVGIKNHSLCHRIPLGDIPQELSTGLA